MAIDVNVTRKINKDFVQVEAEYKNKSIRYYQVPVQRADKFCHQFKETEKKSNFRNNLFFALATIGGCGLGNIFLIKSKPLIRTIGAVGVGILSGLVVNGICLNKTKAEEKDVLVQNGAIDITKYLRKSK